MLIRVDWVGDIPTILGHVAHQKILAGLNLVQQPLQFQSDIVVVKPFSMATLYSVAKSSNLGFRGTKPGGWPREPLLLGHTSDVYIQGECHSLLWLLPLLMMLKLMMIIIIAKAISSASSGGHGSAGANTNRNLTAVTNGNLRLND